MTTLVVYPDASTGGTTVDGRVTRTGVDEAFATIIAGAGTSVDATSATLQSPRILASSTSNQFTLVSRSIWTFDTSSIPTAAVLKKATLSLRGTNKSNGFTQEPDVDIVTATPAANNALANSDYGQLGSSVLGSISYANWSTSARNAIDLLLSAITKAGVTGLGGKISWDTDGSFGGTWASGAACYVVSYYADQTGTTNDPSLTVLYTARRTMVIS